MLVAGEEQIGATAGTRLYFPDDRFAVFAVAFAGHERQQQSVLRVDGGVIPMVPALPVSGIIGVASLFLFADEGPFFIELNFTGFGEKRRRVRRAGPSRDRQQVWRIASRCFC